MADTRREDRCQQLIQKGESEKQQLMAEIEKTNTALDSETAAQNLESGNLCGELKSEGILLSLHQRLGMIELRQQGLQHACGNGT
jgi:hypothetical protein